ncbi:myelin transcription factor 1-like [Linepithema humile]|uniref:myelin transcription factor 1-like n=1 Tax=Linepithema humile TaxID=83485 RepID=UPI00351E1947
MVVEGVVRGTRRNHDERATRRLGVRRRADTSPEAGPSSRARIVLTPELVDLVSDESMSSLREEEEQEEEEERTYEGGDEEEEQEEEEERTYEGGDEEGYTQDGWGMGDRGYSPPVMSYSSD